MNPQIKVRNVPSRSESVREWEDQLAGVVLTPPEIWHEPGYDLIHNAKIGVVLGLMAGCTSLVLNIIGSVLWPTIARQAQHPLQLIQVYLTFPLGESALTLNNGALLALGCVLYLTTGMLYGVLFVLAISYFIPRAGMRVRLAACSILALTVWAVNFYCLLAWLQPLLFGGRWIVELIPWWVAALTHLAFGCTLAVLYPLGPTGSKM